MRWIWCLLGWFRRRERRGRWSRGCRCGRRASWIWLFRCLLREMLVLMVLETKRRSRNNLRIAMNSSVLSNPAAEMILDAPPGWSFMNAVPSNTSPFTTNHGAASLSCFRKSSMVISRFTSSLVILTSCAASVTGSSAFSPPICSPQYPFVRLPPDFLTRSIQPPGIRAGCVGCSKRK